MIDTHSKRLVKPLTIIALIATMTSCNQEEPQHTHTTDDRFSTVEVSEAEENETIAPEEPSTPKDLPNADPAPSLDSPTESAKVIKGLRGVEKSALVATKPDAKRQSAGKLSSAMSGESGSLVVGRGSGGMGMRGTGKGGGGEAFGRVGGLESGSAQGFGGLGLAGSAGRGRGGVSERGIGLADIGKKRVAKKRVARVQPRTNSESYKNHGVNSLTKTSEDKRSTFSIDVDTGAYTIARRKLNEGVMPPAASVRVEEFVNYFSYNYPQPDSGPFGVSLEAAPSPFVADKNRYLMRVGVQGKRVAQKDRKPVHLVFLVDVSGSMNRPDKLGLAKKSLKILTNSLTKNDTVGLVTYAGNTRAVLQPTSITEKGKILEGIDSLTSGGGTAMNSGMETAYKMAMQSSKPGHVTRVIVLSDGDANIGPVSFDDILKNVKSYVDEGVTLSTIGFGMGNYKDSLMEQLANKGNGNYYYIDTLDEANKVFGEQAGGTLEVIAKDVKIQVEFNPEVVDSYRLVGYENRDIADKDFRNDRVDAGEIGAGHSVTAFYEVVLTDAADKGNLATVRMRHKKPDGYDATEQTFAFAVSELKDKLNDASKDFQFGAAVAAFAELLRGSPYARDLNLDLVMEVAQASSSSSQKDRAEFIKLVKKAKKISN